MKNSLTKIILFSVIFFIVPLFLIQAQEYEPISPVPNLTTEDNTVPELGDYLSRVFTFTIGIGAALAVVQIAIAGVQYMTSSAVGSIETAKTKIQDAIWGLLLLLSTYIILNQINPDILKFRLGKNLGNDLNTQIENSSQTPGGEAGVNN